ncbi:MAG: hypothetical protein JWO86_29 [Myxococcaceae bacterium]|nr:hypothetical protein [Myxococcaceae bacterium]
MPESGQRASSAATGAFAALGAACALVPALAMWGFTVDDALIPVRYAHNLATGSGYRFDAHGASTDGVTPLPWAVLLAPLSGGDALTALVRAKVLGVVAWTGAGAMLGARVGGMVRRRLHAVMCAMALVVMGVAFPLGAWAASGMETGVAMAIATIAATRVGRGRWGVAAGIAGMVAAFRPEMVVWAMVVGAGAGAGESESESAGGRGRTTRGLIGAIVAAGPFGVCAVVRMVVFGRPAPLAVLAKPSDLAHGAIYVGAAALVVLTPLVVVAPVALVRGPARAMRVARVLVMAFFAHALAVMAAGGDWMPYARLMVPVAPSLVIAFVAIARCSRPAVNAGRLLAALVLGTLLAMRAAPAGRGVQADRADLVLRARPLLADARVVAALDIGWVGASTDAAIVDLAGLTDPAIALLPGGHTSKRVDTAMLLDRGVDTVVVYSDLRVVEARIVRSELFASRFERVANLPVGTRGASYTVYRRRPPADPAAP